MRIVFVLLALCLSLAAPAAERETVCARQYGLFGWTRPSPFEAAIVKGAELNHASRLRNYLPAATYIVIFNDQDRVHVLHLELPRLMKVAQGATDEFGKRWQVSRSQPCV